MQLKVLNVFYKYEEKRINRKNTQNNIVYNNELILL